ncbi:type-F conjugative transfer system secretin TraK [Sphingomonas sp. H39-1-10]|uniref:type-F conjugative transfer system secretin TraK n=1 Tax=Sphingomonas pollutisoli TaxID=3030829 RepID=UPI0023B9477D|nr:type-F conjugative transfer system secretin TraK [Sphingomonas pollutisoli]MDF0490470.1 type-F conjugative transfer system secretin TraK [Sphingomonas pollutisoli]
MMSVCLIAGMAAGCAFLSRIDCHASRTTGAVLVGGSLLIMASPALADQTVMAADSAQVDCTASARDLTRISLVEDQFASVSKVSSGSAQDDFTVVNEPLRGDIYLSVPEGYGRPSLSFFGTTRRGYVYKFVCRIDGDDARQVFVSNPAIARGDAEGARHERAGPREAAVALIRAMYGGGVIDGYEMRQRSLAPANIGALKVQLIAEYRGEMLNGRVLRIENKGRDTMTLDSKVIAPASALAVSVAEPELAPGRVTTAYLVWQNGSSQ